MIRSLYLLLPMFLSSCAVYRGSFDCPPKRGIGCKSVSEIESMIVETKKGPDLFQGETEERTTCADCRSDKQGYIAISPALSNLKRAQKRHPRQFTVNDRGEAVFKASPVVKRIWTESSTTPSGHLIGDHYIYFVLEDDHWILQPNAPNETLIVAEESKPQDQGQS